MLKPLKVKDHRTREVNQRSENFYTSLLLSQAIKGSEEKSPSDTRMRDCLTIPRARARSRLHPGERKVEESKPLVWPPSLRRPVKSRPVGRRRFLESQPTPPRSKAGFEESQSQSAPGFRAGVYSRLTSGH